MARNRMIGGHQADVEKKDGPEDRGMPRKKRSGPEDKKQEKEK